MIKCENKETWRLLVVRFLIKHLRSILTILCIIIIFSGFTLLNSFRENSAMQTDFLLSTMINIKAFGDNAEAAVEAAMNRVREIENRMSAYKDTSDIGRLNQEGFHKPVKVHPDTYYVVQKGIYYSKLTEGYFDITIKPLAELWGITGEDPRVPSQKEIDQALDHIGYTNVQLDDREHTITFLKENTGLDLGAIAKGYAADEVIKVLKEHGIERAYADLGGNIVVLGQKKIGRQEYIKSYIKGEKIPKYQDWKIGIQDPFQGRGLYVAVVEVSDKAVVSSGSYERNFEQNGEIYHHILDPFTGYPAQNGLVSATIITEHSIDADALSTSLFLLGEEKGMEFIESQPGIEAITINKNKEIRITKGLKGKVKIVDQSFTVK
jgi:thiamine biosynthesis lipoprotein